MKASDLLNADKMREVEETNPFKIHRRLGERDNQKELNKLNEKDPKKGFLEDEKYNEIE